MNIMQLKYFVSAAKLLNFTKAAEENFVTQQTLSQQIGALEAELEIKLFMRLHNNIHLTTAGKAFYVGVNRILRELNDLLIHAKNLKNYDQALTIGYSSIRAHHFISKMLEKIRQVNENITFITVERSSHRCVSLLDKGVLDIIFIDENSVEAISNIEFIELESANHAVFVSKKHPLAQRSSVVLNDLRDERFIQIGSKVDNSVEMPSFITKMVSAISKKITAVDRIDPLLLMVANNIGVAILPETYKEVIRDDDTVCVEIKDFDFVSKFGCAYLKDNILIGDLLSSVCSARCRMKKLPPC